jgi:hypothetical protein
MMLEARERCSIKGHVRDAIDANSDDSVTTTCLLYNGMSPTQESKLQDKNNLLHTHTHTHTRVFRRGDICDAICLTLSNNSIITQMMMMMMMMMGSRNELQSKLLSGRSLDRIPESNIIFRAYLCFLQPLTMIFKFISPNNKDRLSVSFITDARISLLSIYLLLLFLLLLLVGRYWVPRYLFKSLDIY